MAIVNGYCTLVDFLAYGVPAGSDSDDDVVICHSSLLAEMPQGEGQLISLGRDPDCPLGERGDTAFRRLAFQ